MNSKESSTNGKTLLTARSFSAKEICRILDASKGLPLKSIEQGTLKISFLSEPLKEAKEIEQKSLSSPIAKIQEEIPGEIISDRELQETLEEIERENLMIQDPAGYEKQILDERVFDEAEDQEDLSERRARPNIPVR